MKFLKVAVLFFGLAAAFAVRAQGGTYPVSGRVIDRLSRRPVAYAAVVLAGQEQKGASTDSLGRFRIERVKPGIWRLAVSSVGYKSLTTSYNQKIRVLAFFFFDFFIYFLFYRRVYDLIEYT